LNSNLARAEARWRRQADHLERMIPAVPLANEDGAAVQYTDVELEMLAEAARGLGFAADNLLDVANSLNNRREEEEQA